MGIYNSKSFEKILETNPQNIVKYVNYLWYYDDYNFMEVISKCMISYNCNLNTFIIINDKIKFEVGSNFTCFNNVLNVKFDNLADYELYFKKFDKFICSPNKFLWNVTTSPRDYYTNTGILRAIFSKSESEILCYYISYFWFVFNFTDYAEVLQNILSDAQINQINNENAELLILSILDELPNFKCSKYNANFNVDKLCKLVELLCLKKDNFILLLKTVYDAPWNKTTKIKIIINVCKLYKSRYSQIYMTNEFNDFIITFINSLDYENLIKNQKELIELIPNHEIWHMTLDKHISYSNFDSIIEYIETTQNVENLDLILSGEWDEDSLNKLQNKFKNPKLNASSTESILKILKIGILKKYFNLIKIIIERFISNGNYISLVEIYPTLNEQYDSNIIHIFTLHDFAFNAKKHLTKKNYNKWNNSGKIKIYRTKSNADSDCSDADCLESDCSDDETQTAEGVICDTRQQNE